MKKDPILDELHRIRREHAKAFNFDPSLIVADLRLHQAAEGREVVRLPPKPVRKLKVAS